MPGLEYDMYKSKSNDSFLIMLDKAKILLVKFKSIKVVQISSVDLREGIKNFVKEYFQTLRPELAIYKIKTDELDGLMQSLMKMANSYTSRSIYIKYIEKVRQHLINIETTKERLASDILVDAKVQGISKNKEAIGNKSIIETLKKIVPSAAISYQQAINDLQNQRISYRGTVAELREVLREVLDYLAPDMEVISTPNFKLKEGIKQPTMKQKTRFILKNRKKSATAIAVPEQAVAIIDEGIVNLVRATYNRGSQLTHNHGEGKFEALQIKRYLDTVLCELLEIG